MSKNTHNMNSPSRQADGNPYMGNVTKVDIVMKAPLLPISFTSLHRLRPRQTYNEHISIGPMVVRSKADYLFSKEELQEDTSNIFGVLFQCSKGHDERPSRVSGLVACNKPSHCTKGWECLNNFLLVSTFHLIALSV